MAIKMNPGREPVEEGKHTGSIEKVGIRQGGSEQNPYQYLDLYIPVDGTADGDKKAITLTASYPLPMTPNGMTAQMFDRFGIAPAVGEDADETQLVGVRVTFLTQDKPGKKEGQVFSEIIRSTLKPE